MAVSGISEPKFQPSYDTFCSFPTLSALDLSDAALPHRLSPECAAVTSSRVRSGRFRARMVFVAVKAALFIISSLHTRFPGLLVYTIAFRARLLLCVFRSALEGAMTSGTGKVGRTVVGGEALRTTCM